MSVFVEDKLIEETAPQDKEPLIAESLDYDVDDPPEREGTSHLGTIQGGIERSRPLTPAEERALAVRVRAGDTEARDRFVEANLRLVAKICHRFRGGALPMEDLLMEGTIGLIEAVDRFEPERGLRFSTCAVPWIAGRLRRALQKRHLIYIPQRVASEMHRIDHEEDLLAQQLRYTPTDAELAAALDTDVDEMRRLRVLSFGPVSTNVPLDGADGDISLEDAIADDQLPEADEMAEAGLARQYLERCLTEVRERDRDIVLLRFGLAGGRPYSYAELARQFGLTRTRVKQICDALIARTRAQIAAETSSTDA